MRSFGETHEPVPPEPGPVGTGSTAEQRGRRHFGWVKPRLAVALDGRFAWRHRMAVMMRGRSTARAELVVPNLEIELAKKAVGRLAWRWITAEPLDSEQRTARRMMVVLLTKEVRTGTTTRTSERLARQLWGALAGAGVDCVTSVLVDVSPPNFELPPVWTPENQLTQRGDLAARTSARPEEGRRNARAIAVIGSREAAQGALDRRQPPGTPRPRLRLDEARGRRLLTRRRRHASGSPPAAPIAVGAIVTFLVAFVLSQVVARSAAQREEQLLWWRISSLRLALGASVIASALSAARFWVEKQRLARARHPGNDPRSLREFGKAARQVMNDFVASYSVSRRGRVAQWVCVMTGAVAGGVFLGAMYVVRLDLLSTLWGLLALAAGYAVWRLVVALLRRTRPYRLVGFGVISTAIFVFGQWRLYLYFAGMGIAPSEVDVPKVDALTVAVRPLAGAALLAGFGIAFWKLFNAHTHLLAFVVAFVYIVGGSGGVLLSTLDAAQQAGRRVAAGLAVPVSSGFRLTPGPMSECVLWVAPEVPIDVGQLPHPVWEVGTHGTTVLVLAPDAARRANPVPAAGRIARDLVAPLWPLQTSQVILVPRTTARC
jgi:hypothetical protein